MSSDQTIYRPVLVRHARFRWDDIRKQHQIVFPEGVLVLNESGASIVSRCDGRSTEELIKDLENEVSDGNLAADVQTFLLRLVEKGLLIDALE